MRTISKTLPIIVLSGLLAISGCASRSSAIAPTAVPSANYAGMSCDETKTTLSQKQSGLNALMKSQNNTATADIIFVTLFLLPLGSIFGGDNEGELAQAKGEVMALQGAVNINCRSKS